MALGKLESKSDVQNHRLTPPTAAAAAGGLVAAAYLDGKYQVRRDLNIIRGLKRAEREYNRRSKHLCNPHHLHRKPYHAATTANERCRRNPYGSGEC